MVIDELYLFVCPVMGVAVIDEDVESVPLGSAIFSNKHQSECRRSLTSCRPAEWLGHPRGQDPRFCFRRGRSQSGSPWSTRAAWGWRPPGQRCWFWARHGGGLFRILEVIRRIIEDSVQAGFEYAWFRIPFQERQNVKIIYSWNSNTKKTCAKKLSNK